MKRKDFFKNAMMAIAVSLLPKILHPTEPHFEKGDSIPNDEWKWEAKYDFGLLYWDTEGEKIVKFKTHPNGKWVMARDYTFGK